TSNLASTQERWHEKPVRESRGSLDSLSLRNEPNLHNFSIISCRLVAWNLLTKGRRRRNEPNYLLVCSEHSPLGARKMTKRTQFYIHMSRLSWLPSRE